MSGLRRSTIISITVLCFLMVISATVVDARQDAAVGPPNQAEDQARANREALLKETEANRDKYISEILGIWGSQLGSQLELQLPRANADQLLNARGAKTVNELNIALLGPEAGGPAFVPDPLFVGQTTRDWSYTAVTPCRIVDTRFQTAPVTGPIPAGGTREFYVYGTTNVSEQGGNPAGCSSPVGEPRGVHINVTAVPVGGSGNLRVYPANIGTPNASLVNYVLGTNIANAATIQTFFSIGPREIEVFSSSTSHVVIDVLGYYINPAESDGVEFAETQTLISLTATDVTALSIVVTAPAAGFVTVTASGLFDAKSSGLDIGRCSITTGTILDFSNIQIVTDGGDTATTNSFWPMAATRGFSVNAGSTTFRLVCDEFTGAMELEDRSMTAVFSRQRP